MGNYVHTDSVLRGGTEGVTLLEGRRIPQPGACRRSKMVVNCILRDGDTVKLGDVVLTAYNTPGHTKGSTTWVTTLTDSAKAYTVAAKSRD